MTIEAASIVEQQSSESFEEAKCVQVIHEVIALKDILRLDFNFAVSDFV